MKHRLAFFVFACLCAQVVVFAQEPAADSIAVAEYASKVGKTLYATSFSPDRDYALLMFRERNKKGTDWKQWGVMTLLHTSSQEPMWTESVNFSRTSALCTAHGVLVSGEGTLAMKDWYNGAVVWTQACMPVMQDAQAGVVLAYGTVGGTKLHAYSLRDGSELWKIPAACNRNWGWDNVAHEDADCIVVVNNDVLRLNILTGEADVYEAKTGVVDTGSQLANAFSALAMSAGTNFRYTFMPIGASVVSALHSDVLRCDTCYYFADRTHVAKLDSRLHPLWRTELPNRQAARSMLYVHDGTLYMASLGYGLTSHRERKAAGTPFVAAFDTATGTQQFMKMLTGKKCMADSAIFTSDGCTVVFPDSTCCVSFRPDDPAK